MAEQVETKTSSHLVSLGSSSLKVSRLCLGTWQAHGWSSSDRSSMIHTLQMVLDHGINFIDTAHGYGNGYAEQLIREAIGSNRDQYVIATKAPLKSSRPDKLKKALEQNLKDLGTDYIDLYQQHWPTSSPPLEDTIGAMEQLRDEGKIRAIGVSNWMEQEWSEVNEPSRIDCLQPCYNLLWRHVESKVLPLCRENNIGVIPYSPLCQGLLTGKFRELSDIPSDSRKNNVLAKKENFSQVLSFLTTLETIASSHNCTQAEIALSWLLHQPGVTSVITGCSQPVHFQRNIRALTIVLEPEEQGLLAKESKKFLSLTAKYKSLWDWHPRY